MEFTHVPVCYRRQIWPVTFLLVKPSLSLPIVQPLWASGYMVKQVLFWVPTGCIGVKLWPFVRNNLFRYAMPREDILTKQYYFISRCSVQLCYLYKPGAVICDLRYASFFHSNRSYHKFRLLCLIHITRPTFVNNIFYPWRKSRPLDCPSGPLTALAYAWWPG